MSILLRHMNVAYKLSQEDRTYIAGLIKTVEIPAGETWSIESKQSIGCLEQGLLMKVVRLKYARRIVGIHKDGDSFPLGTLDINFRFKAVEPSVLHYIVQEDVEAIYLRYMRLVGLLARIMERDMGQTRYYLRLHEEPDALMRYQLYTRRYPVLAPRLPAKALAEILMMSEKMVLAARKERRLKHI